MLRQKMLIKKRSQLEAQRKTLLQTRQQLRATEDELQAKIDSVDAVDSELEAQIETLTQQQTETDDAIADILAQIDEIDSELASLGGGEDRGNEPDEDGQRTRRSVTRRSAARSFRSRSGCFSSREAMEEFYAQRSVADFVSRVRAMAVESARPGARRVISGAELAIPTEVLDIVRDNLGSYSRLLKHVRLRQLRGKARAMVTGKVPDGVWTEACARLNELAFAFSAVELDGYKVGGFVTICRAVLADASDVDLGEEIVENLLRAIAQAVDKAIVFGKGSTGKMPVGFVTRLAETQKPVYWNDQQGEWTDLHTTNVLKLNLSSATGVAYFQGLMAAMGKAKPNYTNGKTVWVMNRATHMQIKAAGLVFTDAGALVSAMDGSIPVEGGTVEELEWMPDGMIAGGYLDAYIMAEREGSTWERSDEVLFFDDMSAFKATARYDGKPILGEAFVAFTIDGSEVTTAIEFMPDRANEPLNALVVTGASVKSGAITATISGATSGSPRYAVQPTAASVEIHGNDVIIPGKFGWVEYVSGVKIEGAKSGQTLHVVELDGDGHIVSYGHAALTAQS